MKTLGILVAAISLAGCALVAQLDDSFEVSDGGGREPADGGADATVSAPDGGVATDGGSVSDGGFVSDGSVATGGTYRLVLDSTFGSRGMMTFPLADMTKQVTQLPVSLAVVQDHLALVGGTVVTDTQIYGADLFISSITGGGQTAIRNDGAPVDGILADDAGFSCAIARTGEDDAGDNEQEVTLLTTAWDGTTSGATMFSLTTDEQAVRFVRLGALGVALLGQSDDGPNIVSLFPGDGGTTVRVTEQSERKWFGSSVLPNGDFLLAGGCNPHSGGCPSTTDVSGFTDEFFPDASLANDETRNIPNSLLADVMTDDAGNTLAVGGSFPGVDETQDPAPVATTLTFFDPTTTPSTPSSLVVADGGGNGIALPGYIQPEQLGYGNVRLVPNPNPAIGGFIAAWALLAPDSDGTQPVHFTFVRADGQVLPMGTVSVPLALSNVALGSLVTDSEGRIYAALSSTQGWVVLRLVLQPA